MKNLDDGSVYIEAEGEPHQLEDFLKWCRQGPAFAFVESVAYESYPPEGYGAFTIEH